MTANCLITVILTFLLSSPVFAQDPMAPREPGSPGGDKFFGREKQDDDQDQTRSVRGKVLDADGDLVEGAIVQIKDLKTLRIRSFITLEDGSYRFHGLSRETDYELQAKHEDEASKVRRLSVYDNRKQAVIDLKLKPEA